MCISAFQNGDSVGLYAFVVFDDDERNHLSVTQDTALALCLRYHTALVDKNLFARVSHNKPVSLVRLNHLTLPRSASAGAGSERGPACVLSQRFFPRIWTLDLHCRQRFGSASLASRLVLAVLSASALVVSVFCRFGFSLAVLSLVFVTPLIVATVAVTPAAPGRIAQCQFRIEKTIGQQGDNRKHQQRQVMLGGQLIVGKKKHVELNDDKGQQ